MKRLIILGGLGLFGRAAADLLRTRGFTVQTASRRPGANLLIDANNPTSIKSALHPGDLIIDAAGPFQSRSTALVEAAIESRVDIIDLNDSLSYAQRLLALETQIAAANIRILSGASTVSAVSAAVIKHSGIQTPHTFTAFLAPATRTTANAGTARSLVESVGRPIQIWRDGHLQTVPGWSEPRHFPMPPPTGPIRARLFESADALQLPRIWPTLQQVTMHVDTNTPGLNTLLRFAARWPTLRTILATQTKFGTKLSRLFGSSSGGLGYEITTANQATPTARYALTARKSSYLTAIAPAILAAQKILENRFEPKGLISPDKHVEPTELFECLKSNGIHLIDLT